MFYYIGYSGILKPKSAVCYELNSEGDLLYFKVLFPLKQVDNVIVIDTFLQILSQTGLGREKGVMNQ